MWTEDDIMEFEGSTGDAGLLLVANQDLAEAGALDAEDERYAWFLHEVYLDGFEAARSGDSGYVPSFLVEIDQIEAWDRGYLMGLRDFDDGSST